MENTNHMSGTKQFKPMGSVIDDAPKLPSVTGPMLQGPFSGNTDASPTPQAMGKLEPQFQSVYTAWQGNRNKANTGQLLKAINPVLDTAIHSYGGGSKGSPTLRSRARKMALNAMESYDPQKGALKTHLLTRLQRLQRISAKQQQMISVPEQIIMDRQHLVDAENELSDRLGRDPSDQEITDHTGLSLKRLGHIRKAHVPLSEGAVLAGQNLPEAEQTLPASTIPGTSDEEDAWVQYVYTDLGTRDQAIMDYMLGLHGTPKLQPKEVAVRLGLSPGAISQRAKKIQAVLDEREDIGLFG